MLPKQNRLTSKKDFTLVLEKGKIIQTPTFGLAFYHAKEAIPSRVGFIISTKISKLATERNTVKRRLRTVVRNLLFSVKPGFLFVILVRQSILSKSQEYLERGIRQSFGKTGALPI